MLSTAHIIPHPGKVVGAGSTLLLLARNKDDLEVMNLALQNLFIHLDLLQVTKEIVRDVRPGLAVEVCIILPRLFCHISRKSIDRFSHQIWRKQTSL